MKRRTLRQVELAVIPLFHLPRMDARTRSVDLRLLQGDLSTLKISITSVIRVVHRIRLTLELYVLKIKRIACLSRRIYLSERIGGTRLVCRRYIDLARLHRGSFHLRLATPDFCHASGLNRRATHIQGIARITLDFTRISIGRFL